MDLFDAIAARRSYRAAYTAQPVPEQHLRQIVQAGLDAPSGKNLQTTRFIIVNDPEKLAQIRVLFNGQPFIATAQAFIAVIFDANPEPAPEYPYTFEVEDCAAATENILLAATALGYASAWLDGILRFEQRAEKLGKILNLPESKKIRILLPIGVPAERSPRVAKLPFDQRAFFNSWKSE